MENINCMLDIYLIYVLTLSIFPGFLYEDTGAHNLGSWFFFLLSCMNSEVPPPFLTKIVGAGTPWRPAAPPGHDSSGSAPPRSGRRGAWVRASVPESPATRTKGSMFAGSARLNRRRR
jgi:hypothetical protein